MSANQIYNISLSFDKLNVIMGALGELPAKVSFDLICELRDQIIAQSTVPPNENVVPIVPVPDGVPSSHAG